MRSAVMGDSEDPPPDGGAKESPAGSVIDAVTSCGVAVAGVLEAHRHGGGRRRDFEVVEW